MSAMQIGVAFTPFETRTDVIVRLTAQAERLGLGRVEVAEGWTHDSTILLAELAMRTSRIELGALVVSAWGRTPAPLALGARLLRGGGRARAPPGRAAAGRRRGSGAGSTLGIGGGPPPLAEGFH